MIFVGTAGWTLQQATDALPTAGTQLERYANVFRCTEINSSFHRGHATATYARWAASTPRRFRFAVKLPRIITHELRLRRARQPLAAFLAQARGLGRKLGPLLVQLPPSLDFEPRVARGFFGLLRELHDGPVVCEPRHASWFTPAAERLLVARRIARAAADPAPVPAAGTPGGWDGMTYVRLHGSPRTYWSVYDPASLEHWAIVLLGVPRGTEAWCIFDNTAGGGAARNASELLRRVGPRR